MYVKVIAILRWDVFLRHGVDLLGMLLSKLKLFELVLLKEMVMIQMYDMLQNVYTTIHCVIPSVVTVAGI